jgi:hypothetical protein
MMDTETLDKLYLEWSQFTKARNLREIAMEKALRWMANNPGAHPMNVVAIAKDALNEVAANSPAIGKSE